MTAAESLSVLVVVERRPVVHAWADETWRVVGVLPAADTSGELPRRLRGDESGDQYLIGPATVTLHRSDVSSYRHNLGTGQPRLFVGLRRDGDGGPVPWRIILVTAAPDEAQSLMDHGDDHVEAVSMPADLSAWVQDFADRAPPEETFHKRRRKEWRQDPGA